MGKALNAIVDAIAEWPVAARVRFLEMLRERICLDCGELQKESGSQCYCTWDE